MQFYNRETGKIEKELEYGENLLNFLYKTFIGRILLKLIFIQPFLVK